MREAFRAILEKLSRKHPAFAGCIRIWINRLERSFLMPKNEASEALLAAPLPEYIRDLGLGTASRAD